MPARSKKGKHSPSSNRRPASSDRRKPSPSAPASRVVSAAVETSRDPLREGFEQLRAHVAERFEQLRVQVREEFEQLDAEIE